MILNSYKKISDLAGKRVEAYHGNLDCTGRNTVVVFILRWSGTVRKRAKNNKVVAG